MPVGTVAASAPPTGLTTPAAIGRDRTEEEDDNDTAAPDPKRATTMTTMTAERKKNNSHCLDSKHI